MQFNEGAESSVILVFDRVRQEVVHRLGEDGEASLEYFTFVLETHPRYEEVLLSGGGCGKVILWNMQQGCVLRQFRETAVFAHDPYVFSDLFDGAFSPCGNFFVVSSLFGSLSFYSIRKIACLTLQTTEKPTSRHQWSSSSTATAQSNTTPNFTFASARSYATSV